MLTKMNAQFSVLRPALLALFVVLTLLATVSPATAAVCSYGERRTIILDSYCCNYPSVSVTKQNQACCTDGTWMNDGGPYCGSSSFCAF